MARLLLLSALLVGCNSDFAPASYVSGLRVLAIKATPPEVGFGEAAMLTQLSTAPDEIFFIWSICTLPPVAGEPTNADCITAVRRPYLIPISNSSSTMVTVPPLGLDRFAAPDSTGGIYLPVRLTAASDAFTVVSIYRLRVNVNHTPPNQNPTLSGVFLVQPTTPVAGVTDVLTPIEDANSIVIHKGEKLRLRAGFTPDSAETYLGPDGQTRTETLSAYWYATAGTFSSDSTGNDVDTIWTIDSNLPDLSTIELWVVGHDERGGTDYLYRTLSYQ